MKGQKTILEIGLGAVIVIAVAIGVHRIGPSVAPSLPTVVQPRSIGHPTLALIRLDEARASTVSTYATSVAMQMFGPNVRTLTYRAPFLASTAEEGANGALYLAYHWTPAGDTPSYDPNSIGIVTGGAVREIFKGNIFDATTIVGDADGYPVFAVDMGGVLHMTDLIGSWKIDAFGPYQTSRDEPTRRNAAPACFRFAGGMLCTRGKDVTYTHNGALITTLHDARIIGAGSERFLILLADVSPTMKTYVEGFAVPR